MNCNKAIKQLPAYLDRELSRSEVDDLQQHLQLCVFCSTELAALRSTSRMLDAWPGTSPRRSYVQSAINQINAEQHGLSHTRRIGVPFLKRRRWVSGPLRAAAAMIFVIGASIFSVHVPVKHPPPEIALEAGDYLRSPQALIPPGADLMRSHIRPSEYGLAWRGMQNRGRIIATSSGQPSTPGTTDIHPFSRSGRFLEVNHIYFPGEGMPVESVIPVELP